jgi:Cdc6-like AAA superfamily ATPase
VNELVCTQHDQKSHAILDWLTPTDYHSQHNDLIGRRQEGTGEWLLKSCKFQQWAKGEEYILFCPGIPGAGKTITASIVIDYLYKRCRSDPSIGIAFLYCNFKRQQEQRPIDLFLSLLKQLSQRLPSMPGCVIKLYKNHERDRTRPSLLEVSVALQTVITECSRAFIIIDALDECKASDRLELLSEIFKIQDRTKSNFLATSRFIPDI